MYKSNIFAKSSYYNVPDFGVTIRNPERNKDYCKIYAEFNGQELNEEVGSQIFDLGQSTGTWTYNALTPAEKLYRIRRLITMDLGHRGLILLNDKNTFNLTDFGNALIHETVPQSDIYIKFLCIHKFPNPTTSVVRNHTSVFYVLLKTIEEINKRLAPNEKRSIYRHELFFVLSSPDNNYLKVIDNIFNKRYDIGKAKTDISTLKKYLDNSNEYIKLEDKTIESYIDVFCRYLRLTTLFNIHGKYDPIIDFSPLEIDKIKMLIEFFEQGKFDCDTNDFNYGANYDNENDLFNSKGMTAQEYFKWGWNCKLPWEDNEDSLRKICASQEKYFFKGITFDDDPIKIRLDRINKQLGTYRLKKFDDILNLYETNITEVLTKPDFYSNLFKIAPSILFEGALGIYCYNTVKVYNNMSTIVNTGFDDDGLPVSSASGENTNNTGEDICLIQEYWFINIEPTLKCGTTQARDECASCARHIDNVRNKLNIDKGYSIIVAPTISYDTIYFTSTNIYRKTDKPVIPMSTKYFLRLMNDFKTSNNPNYLKEKLDEIILKIQNNELSDEALLDLVNCK